MKNRIGAFVASVIFVVCAGTSALADPPEILVFEKGKTTYTEVVQALGEPSAEAKAEDGSRTIVYLSETRAKHEDVVSFFISKSEPTGQKRQFSFDPNGLLKSYETIPAK